MSSATIPQPGTANNAPDIDGTPGPYQRGSTLVPNPGKADGKLGTGSNQTFIPESTPVPNPRKADGMPGTGTNSRFIPESTPVPNPRKADGQLGIGSFLNGWPAEATPVPNPGKADGRGINTNPFNASAINIVPKAAVYSTSGLYTVSAGLTSGLRFVIVLGPNETGAIMDPAGSNGGPFNLSNETPFTYIGGGIEFEGFEPSTPVTAGLYSD